MVNKLDGAEETEEAGELKTSRNSQNCYGGLCPISPRSQGPERLRIDISVLHEKKIQNKITCTLKERYLN